MIFAINATLDVLGEGTAADNFSVLSQSVIAVRLLRTWDWAARRPGADNADRGVSACLRRHCPPLSRAKTRVPTCPGVSQTSILYFIYGSVMYGLCLWWSLLEVEADQIGEHWAVRDARGRPSGAPHRRCGGGGYSQSHCTAALRWC